MDCLDRKPLQETQQTSSGDSSEQMVDKLTKDLEADIDKARVLFRWLAESVQYVDRSPGDTIPGDDTAGRVLKRRIADADGFSKTFAYLCNLARINCHPVHGFCKATRYGYYPGYPFDLANPQKSPCAHAWNAVQLNNSWYMCDITWAAHFDTNFQSKDLNEQWFMADPDTFLLTHLPYDQKRGIRRSSQHVTNLIRTLDEWNMAPLQYPLSMKHINQLISHPIGVIKAEEASFSIILSTSKMMSSFRYAATLSKTDGSGKYDNRVMTYAVKNKIQIDIRLPEDVGRYRLVICGRNLDEDKPEQEALPLLQYTIDHDSVAGTREPFPSGTGYDWGVLPRYVDAGREVLSPASPIIHTTCGAATIRVKLPTDDEPISDAHKLYHSAMSSEALGAFMHAERLGHKGIYHIQCPIPGDYRLELLVHDEASDENDNHDSKLRLGAAFLIVCQEPDATSHLSPYGRYPTFAGQLGLFYDVFGLTTSIKNSTIRIDSKAEQAFHFPISKSRPVSVSAKLITTFSRIDGNEVLMMTTESEVAKVELWPFVSFIVSVPSRGNHLLKLFSSELEQPESEELVAVYCVQSV